MLPIAISGCGDNLQEQAIGPIIELPLLAVPDPATPFNHSCEPSVAAHDGRVVVASLQLHLASATSYAADARGVVRRVAVTLSSDGGETFAPATDPVPESVTTSAYTGDPVVRASKGGSTFLTLIRVSNPSGNGDIEGLLARSDDGSAWVVLANAPYDDKEWFAIDDTREQLYVGAFGGYWRYAFDGTELGRSDSGDQKFQMSDAYADARGAHFATAGLADTLVPTIVEWDGTSAAAEPVASFDAGADAVVSTTQAWSTGAFEGGSWWVRSRREGGKGSIVLGTKAGTDVVEDVLTAPDANAFLPVAAVDEVGRLHVVWYDSGGSDGVLRYTHSRGPGPFVDGFVDPIVIDPDAVPGGGWYPGHDQDSGDRRLREYIGMATDGDVVHVVWTHSPSPPSRVVTATIRPLLIHD